MLSGQKRLLITLLLFRTCFATLLPDINPQRWSALLSMNEVLIECGLIFMGVVFGYMVTFASTSAET
ncbi:MAG: hypothetical protein DYH03_13435 [Nitrospira sp. NTP1]|nr:hypothetical protein [Nitrospira sp. NTP1]